MEEMSTEALLRELLDQQKKAVRHARIVSVVSCLFAALVVLAALALFPRVRSLTARLEAVLSQTETLSHRAGELAEGVNALVAENGDAVTQALRKLEEADLDGLNEAIRRLGEVDVESLSRSLQKLSEIDVESLSGTIQRISEMDFEGLNEAIQNLNDAVRPLAGLGRLFG